MKMVLVCVFCIPHCSSCPSFPQLRSLPYISVDFNNHYAFPNKEVTPYPEGLKPTTSYIALAQIYPLVFVAAWIACIDPVCIKGDFTSLPYISVDFNNHYAFPNKEVTPYSEGLKPTTSYIALAQIYPLVFVAAWIACIDPVCIKGDFTTVNPSDHDNYS